MTERTRGQKMENRNGKPVEMAGPAWRWNQWIDGVRSAGLRLSDRCSALPDPPENHVILIVLWNGERVMSRSPNGAKTIILNTRNCFTCKRGTQDLLTACKTTIKIRTFS